MTFPEFLKAAAIVLAVGGGVASIAAVVVRQRVHDGEMAARRVRILTLASYILMSLSVACLSLHGLVS